jgi:hypothetical protein
VRDSGAIGAGIPFFTPILLMDGLIGSIHHRLTWRSTMTVRATPSYFKSLVGKVFGTAMIPVALFLLLIAGYMLPTLHRLLLDSKKEGLQQVVEGVHAQVNHLAEEAKAGRLSQEEAQSRAKDLVSSLRYGAGNYVYIHGPNLTALVLPVAK